MTRKVLALVRVSSTEQAADDRTGIKRQLEDIQLHCRHYGLEVAKEYRLEGISGAYVDRSPLFREMLDTLALKSIAGVVFASMDRFFRPENLSAYDVLRPFEASRKLLFCDLGELDPKNQQDQMKIVIWGQMAGMERSRIRDRMMRGKEFKRHDPTSKTDPLPRGVVFRDGKFHYTEDSERVREAFKRYLKGESLIEIAQDLGFSAPTNLRATLKQRWWIGIKASTKQRDYGNVRRTRADGSLADGRKVARKEPILIPTNLAETPLISPAEFQRVQDMLSQNNRAWTLKKSRGNCFLGSGLLYCACGRKMYHKYDRRPGKPFYYMCKSRWNQEASCGEPTLVAAEVDQTIADAIGLLIIEPEIIEREIRRASNGDERAEKERSLARLEKSVASLTTKLQRAVDFSLEHPEFIDRVQKLKQDLAQDRVKLGDLQRELASQLQDGQVRNLAQTIKRKFVRFAELPMPERKRLLAEYIERIDRHEGVLMLKMRTSWPSDKGDRASRRKAGARAGTDS